MTPQETRGAGSASNDATGRSRRTVRYYAKIVKNLRASVEADGGSWTGQSAAAEIAARDLTAVSQTSYVSAVRCIHAGDAGFLAALDEAMESAPDRVRRRSTGKRSVGESSIRAVIGELQELPVRGNEGLKTRVVDLVIATRLFGLRPSEWADAKWADEDRSRLFVENGKYARMEMERGPFAGRVWRRGNGKSREMILPEKERDLYVRSAQAAMSGEALYPWEKHERGIQRLHQRAVAQAMKKGLISQAMGDGLTIYSYRHTFAAAAKATLDLFGGEIAALMGHISVTTATRSYARRSAARGGVSVRPTAESVAAVENRTATPVRVVSAELDPVLIEDDPVSSVENKRAARIPRNARPDVSDGGGRKP